MNEVRGVRIKLKPDSLEAARRWAHEINARKTEALVSLAHEDIRIEAAFLEEAAGEQYLIYVMVGAVETSKSQAAASSRAIDRYHHRFKQEYWESTQPLDLLVWLERETP